MDPGVDEILRPLTVSARYAILTESERMSILTCKVGEMVRIGGPHNMQGNGHLGIIQYIGPIVSPPEKNLSQENLTWADRLKRSSEQSSSGDARNCHIGTWFGIELITVSPKCQVYSLKKNTKINKMMSHK